MLGGDEPSPLSDPHPGYRLADVDLPPNDQAQRRGWAAKESSPRLSAFAAASCYAMLVDLITFIIDATSSSPYPAAIALLKKLEIKSGTSLFIFASFACF